MAGTVNELVGSPSTDLRAHSYSVGIPNWLFAYVATALFITIHLTKGD